MLLTKTHSLQNINRNEFQKMLENFGMYESMPKHKVEALFEKYDTANNGVIDYYEFIRGVMNEPGTSKAEAAREPAKNTGTRTYLLTSTLSLQYSHFYTFTSTLSLQHSHLNTLTSTLSLQHFSLQHSHFNTLTSTLSLQHSHFNTLTSTLSLQHSHFNTLTSTL